MLITSNPKRLAKHAGNIVNIYLHSVACSLLAEHLHFIYVITWITFLSPVQHLQTPFNSSDIDTLQYVYVLCTVSYSCGDEIKYVPLTSDFLVFC